MLAAELYEREQVAETVARAVPGASVLGHRLDHLVAAAHRRIERSHGVLEHIADLRPTQLAQPCRASREQVLAAEARAAACDTPTLRKQAQRGRHESALAGARGANHADRLAASHRQAGAGDSDAVAVGDGEVSKLEQHAQRRPSVTRAGATPRPSRAVASSARLTTVTATASPGGTTHQSQASVSTAP